MKKYAFLTLSIALLITACAATPQPESKGLTFIHLNDTYRVSAVEDGTAGGFSRVVSLVRDLQAQGRDVHVLHGGDFLYPSLESQLWDGLQIVDAMNFIDAIAPLHAVAGNHEFDPRGPQPLIDAIRASKFDWLGDNYTFNTGDAEVDAALRTAFTFLHGDRKVGLFSLTLHPDDGGNVRDYLEYADDYMAVAREALGRLDAEGADLVIGVTHLQMWRDVELAQLKADYPALAFIVGGHEHEPQYSPATDGAAVVMKGASNARRVWRIDVDFDADGRARVAEEMLTLDESVPFDPDYEVLAAKWRSRLLELYPVIEARIGAAAFAMDVREEVVRSSETSWGNFITDQMRVAFGRPHADFAFINSGTLRIDDYIAGNIRFEDIARTFGFSSYLRYMTLTGAEFKRVMEAGYRGGPEAQGYFPQVSGFRICIDRSREPFDRIISLQIPGPDGWQEVDATAEYTLVVPDFLYGGGDGYELPKDRFASRPGSELKYLVLDAIINAQGRGESIGVPVTDRNRRFDALQGGGDACFE
jgi:5'-nucleotidase